MCSVNVAEFRNNLSHYLGLSLHEDVLITKNGKTVAVLSNPNKKYYQTLIKLCGFLKDTDTNESYEDMVGEEIMRRCGY